MPLHAAACARSENEAIVRFLFDDKGAHVNMRNHRGQSPLFLFLDSVKCVKILLGNGANVSVRDDEGMTVVHHAAKIGDAELLRLFFQHPTYRRGMRTNDNKTVKDVASAATKYEGEVRELIDEYEP